MARPKVSIIIPVFNGSEFMAQAIDSALAQTCPDVEVLVVNDGSRDEGKTDKVARSYGDRIRYFVKENGGVASALNVGIREMRGDYFCWLSHDDLYYPTKVERQIEAMRGCPPGTVVYCNSELIDATCRVIASDAQSHVPSEEFLYTLIAKGHVNGCTVMIPRKCFEEVGGFDESLPTTQDYALWFLLAQKYPFVHIPSVLVKSRIHPRQGSNVIPSHWRAVNDLHKWFLDEVDSKNLLGLTDARRVSSYLGLARTFNDRFFYSAAKHAALLALRQARSQGVHAVVSVLPSVLVTLASSMEKGLIRFLTIHKKRLWASSNER